MGRILNRKCLAQFPRVNLSDTNTNCGLLLPLLHVHKTSLLLSSHPSATCPLSIPSCRESPPVAPGLSPLPCSAPDLWPVVLSSKPYSFEVKILSENLKKTNQIKPTNHGLFSAWGLSVAALRSLLQAKGAVTINVCQDFWRSACGSNENHQWNFRFQRRMILIIPTFSPSLTANTSCFWGFWIKYFLSGWSISPLCCTVGLEKTSTFFFHLFSFFLRKSSALCHLGYVPITTYT